MKKLLLKGAIVCVIAFGFWKMFPEEIDDFLTANSLFSFVSPQEEGDLHSQEQPTEHIPKIITVFPNTPEETTEDQDQEILDDHTPEALTTPSEFLERGESLFASGHMSLARNDFIWVTENAPDSRIGWKKLIEVQIALHDLSAAEATTKKALLLFPDTDDFIVILGEIFLQKSNFIQAENIFSKLPERSIARQFYLGVLAAHKQQYDKSKTLLIGIQNNPVFGERANVLLQSFAEFELFPEGDPLHLDLLVAKGMNDLRFFEIAISSTKDIIKKKAEYRDAWIILGHSYLSLERYTLAKNSLEKALELDPTKPESSFFLGFSEKMLEEYDSAITHLTLARENGFIPQREVTQVLAESLLGAKYYDTARQEYEKLLEVKGGDVEKYVPPIRILLEFLDDPDAAQILAQKALREYPQSERAKNLFAWSLLEGERYSEAREILENILQQNSEFAPAYYNLGRIFEAEKSFDSALEQFQKAYSLDMQSEIGILAAKRYNKIVEAEY